MSFKIKKGDKVIVLSGKDKGKTGIVGKMLVKSSKLVVDGANIVKKHVKVSKKYPSGGTVEIAKPMPIGKVQLICPSCNKPTRVSYDIKAKTKNRVCKKCNKVITTKLEGKEK